MSDGSVLLSEVTATKNAQGNWEVPDYQWAKARQEASYYGSLMQNGYKRRYRSTPSFAGAFTDGIGGLGIGMQQMGGAFRLTNGAYNGNALSIHHYSTGWTGGSRAQITTYNGAKWGGRLGTGATVANILVGGVQIYQGAKADGNTFGYNAQHATSGVTSGMIGGWAGAKSGAIVGAYFGGWGAIPGAIIGGIFGGWAGSEAGGTIYDSIYY